MKRLIIFLVAAAVVAAIIAVVVTRATANTTKTATTVSTKQIGGVGTVLVNSAGLPLYVNNRDSAGMVRCTGACARVWVPLTVTSGSPTGTSVKGTLGVVALSNGDHQVTLNGRPLYTFVVDHPGKVTGNDVTDHFGGQSFTWHVVTQGAAAPATTPSSSGGYGY